MSLTIDDVKKIAHLARLNLDEKDIPQITDKLSHILQFIDQMNQIDTSDVMPLANPLDNTQRLRADIVTEQDQREKFQSISPQVEAGLYLVPKVIDEA